MYELIRWVDMLGVHGLDAYLQDLKARDDEAE